MPVIDDVTVIGFDTEEENRLSYKAIRARVSTARNASVRGGSDRAIAKHRSRGKLTARERIDVLLDVESPFFEIGQIAGYEVYDDSVPSAALVTGIGTVRGSLCAIFANDATVKGGTYYPLTVKKQLRLQAVARKLRLPCVYLVDSGGVFLPMQDEIFPDEHHFGEMFKNIAEMSADGIVQVAAVMGQCTAGGAYIPAMCDETVIVRGTGTIYLGGPQLVKAATGVDVEPEELGGADVHGVVSGVVDHIAGDDHEALSIVADIVSRGERREVRSPARLAQQPLHSPDTLESIVPSSSKTPMIARDILARLLDGSELVEYRANYGRTIVCGTGHIEGFRVGVIINDGVLFSEDSLKAANFVELCSQRDIPLLFLHNINGFMVGKQYEAEGIAKHGAKLVNAVSCARVPKLSIVIGGSYGAGNLAMCGRSIGPDFMAVWPNAKTTVVGAEQAASVMALMKIESARASGNPLTEDEIEEIKRPIRENYERQGESVYVASRLWVDAIVDPVDTRSWIGLALSMLPVNHGPTRFGVFRM
ncbi:carboxyl transferase domain-containing protein [Rhodococcus sp. P1Y]|uniref:carboxyl transferase domain-containing protein n=1 Tax=Rhodococcus sp. P1Y TaxID=1302308 RepID=UPI000EB123E6|nr:carboxyl transferase domain-containing protein [Rhodococcus sp. P1Y]AYJ47239.1 methylcrotonoyl-CoA carboxylase [Rhodococcus sp. P1Y]